MYDMLTSEVLSPYADNPLLVLVHGFDPATGAVACPVVGAVLRVRGGRVLIMVERPAAPSRHLFSRKDG